MSTYKADVVIVGGGLAGVAAALSARKMSARVLLLEKNPRFGGMAVLARVHSMLTFHSREGKRIIGGIPWQIIERLKTAGGTLGHILDTVGVAYSVTPTDPDLLSLILQIMLEEEGVDYLLESLFIEPVIENERITSIRGIHPGGFFSAQSHIFIDASGDGVLAASCRCPFERGRDGKVMPATLIFSVRGVDLRKVCDYIENNPTEFHGETLFTHLKKSPAVGVSGFFSLWKQARLSIPRDRLLFYQTLAPDEVAINSTRITDFDPLVPEKVNMAHRMALEQVYEINRFLTKDIPGFERCKLSSIANFLGVREGRRICGSYMLSGEDVVMGRRFKDEIAIGGFPTDIHLPVTSGIESSIIGGEGYYGIPYRCLLPLRVRNLLIAGRCFSAQFEAHASARVQATTMAMGQAAGVAAALSAAKRVEPRELPPDVIRQKIVDSGGILEPQIREDLP